MLTLMTNFMTFLEHSYFLKKKKIIKLSIFNSFFPLHLSFKQKYELARCKETHQFFIAFWMYSVCTKLPQMRSLITIFPVFWYHHGGFTGFENEWLFPVSFGVGGRDGRGWDSCVIFLTGNCRRSPADWCLWEHAIVLPESTAVV